MTSKVTILNRLRTEPDHTLWRRKVYDLRRLVAGDYSPVDETAVPQTDVSTPNVMTTREMAGYRDILTRDFESGTSNKMLQAIKTLVLSTAYRMPEIEFKDAHPLEVAVNAEYLARRLGPRPNGCDAVPHMRHALWNYCIDGMGWVWCGVRDGKPTVSSVDTLDVIWDTSVSLLSDIRWVACKWKDTLGYWVEMYGEKPFNDLIGSATGEERDRLNDHVVELWFYYDVDGVRGTHAVYRCGDQGDLGEPLEVTENPHSMDADGTSVPFLPLEPIYYVQAPSVRNPLGVAEMMLPSQLALRKGDKYMNAVLDRGAPWLDVEEGAYSEEELAKFEEGEVGEIITRKANKTPATVREPIEIPSTVLARSQHHEEELFASSGANPYSAGGKVEGIKYAAEVSAIQGNASLVAATLASDHADHWRRVAAKCLANGQKYDQVPLVIVLDGDELHFGPNNPIGPYLRADASPLVSEDTMTFAPRDKRIADAANLLATAVELKDIFPASVKLAYGRYLQAVGVRDTAAHMEVLPPAAPPGAPGMAQQAAPEGGMDPAAMAEAGTVQ